VRLGIATILVAALILIFRDETREDVPAVPVLPAIPSNRSARAEILDGESVTREAARTPIDSPKAAIIKVSDSGGRPVPGAALFGGHAPYRWHRIDGVPLGRTDSQGTATIQPAQGTDRLVAWSSGYLPREVVGVNPGTEHLVVLDSGVTQEFRVETLDGRPVSGVPIVVSHTELSDVDLEQSRGSAIGFDAGRLGRPAFAGVSDESGQLILSCLPAGVRLYVTVNLAGLPYQVADLGESLFLDVPGPLARIRLREVIAAVVDFEPEGALQVARVLESPAQFTTRQTVREMGAVASWERILRIQNPKAWCFVGAESSSGSSKSGLPVRVIDRAGRVSKHVIPLRLASEIDHAQTIYLPDLDRDQLCVATFHMEAPQPTSASGSATPAEMPRIRLSMERDGTVFRWSSSSDSPIELPRGRFRVGLGPEVVHGGLAVEEVDLTAPDQHVVLPLTTELYRYEIHVILPDGRRPLNSGLWIDGMHRSGRKISKNVTPDHGVYTCWSASAELAVSARVLGCSPLSARLRHDLESKENRDIFELRMEPEGSANPAFK
jgi:hypothetical protein